MRGIVEALQNSLGLSCSTLQQDFETLQICTEVVNDFLDVTLSKRAKDKRLLYNMESNEICKRILGKQTLDGMRRQYQLTTLNYNAQITIPRRFMPLVEERENRCKRMLQDIYSNRIRPIFKVEKCSLINHSHS